MCSVATVLRLPTLVLAMVAVGFPLSCRMRPDDMLRPADAVAGASRVHLLMATTRLPDPDPKVGFSSRRSDRLHYADFVMSVPPDHSPGKIEWPRSLPPDASREICALDWKTLDRDGFAAQLKDAVGPRGRQVLVLVHGYNTGFALSLLRSTQILHDSELDVAPVIFSWASRGELAGYGYDRESASLARDGLEELLRRLDRDPRVGSVSVLAHSMGGWLTMETLRQMGIARRGGMGKIRDIVLAAPDIDPGEFRLQWQRAREGMTGTKVPRITVYSSGDDMALRTSTKVWGNDARLGLIDPHGPGSPAWMAEEGVTIIDITRLRAGDPISHSKYANAPGVPREIGKLIASGQLDPARAPGVGERLARGATGLTGQAATTIAGLATAPLAATDREGRDRIADRFGGIFGKRKTEPAGGGNE